jgi:hypothetical protein
MNSAIKIVKRGTSGKPNNVSVPSAGKTEHERELDTASTVKSWVAEWEERKRSLQIAAFVFVRAFDQSRQTSGPAVTAN